MLTENGRVYLLKAGFAVGFLIFAEAMRPGEKHMLPRDPPREELRPMKKLSHWDEMGIRGKRQKIRERKREEASAEHDTTCIAVEGLFFAGTLVLMIQ